MRKLDWHGALKEHRNWLLIGGGAIVALWVIGLISATLSVKALLVFSGIIVLFWSARLLDDVKHIRCICGNLIPPHHAHCYAYGERNPYTTKK